MEESVTKSHSPQDCIYGPLKIPDYCWQIIDTEEFQRLRFICQLGSVIFVFPSANHTRFEHSLGACHLASVLMEHIEQSQPELEIKEEHKQAVIIAALCHSLGHGPFSRDFRNYAVTVDKFWSPRTASGRILSLIYNKYKLNFPKQVIEAAKKYICGEVYEEYPKWLSQIVRNPETGIDVIKFDFLSRDSNRTLSDVPFKYNRLVANCKVIDNQIVWKMTEIHTLEDYFYTLNDMHTHIYKHRVVQAISCMIIDIFKNLPEELSLATSIYDPEKFVKNNDSILFKIGLDIWDDTCLESQILLNRITTRDLYKWVGDIRIRPDAYKNTQYSQRDPLKLSKDIADQGSNPALAKSLRVVSMELRYGSDSKNDNPLLSIPFWQNDTDGIVKLTEKDLSCLLPAHFAETTMRVFVTDKNLHSEALKCFQKWKDKFEKE